MSGDLARAYMEKHYKGVTPGDKQWAIGIKEFSNGGKKKKNTIKENVVDINKKIPLSKTRSDYMKQKETLRGGLGSILAEAFK